MKKSKCQDLVDHLLDSILLLFLNRNSIFAPFGWKITKILLCREAPNIPGNLDKRTTITINGETFEIEADDLESQCVLGRGAYGVVEKVKHKPTGTVLAVKVSFFYDFCIVTSRKLSHVLNRKSHRNFKSFITAHF